jgi:flagella basal body P-ring formation protein FlgA
MRTSRSTRPGLAVRAIALWIALLAIAAPARAELGVITLNQAASVAPGDPALLRDVATLAGEPAMALAGTVIRIPAAGATSLTITTDDLRAALTGRNANWGRLTLRGSACQVRIGDRPRPLRSVEPGGESAPVTIDLTGAQTVRTRLAQLVGRMFNVENEDLRLLFDERDAALLSRSVSEQTRVEIQPASTPSSSRMAFVVWIYEGKSLEPTSVTVRVDVLLRRPVVTATREIRRDEPIAEGDTVEAVQWIAPDGSASVAGSRQAIGMRAKRTIAAGSMIRADALEPPIACRRGDLVKVHCVSGGIVVKAWARAMGRALEGEFVELRMNGSEKTFRARMTGHGAAVMELAG